MGSHRVGHDWSDSAAAAAALRSPHPRQILSLLYSLLLLLLSHFSHVWLFAILWTEAHQAPLSMGFFRQEYQSGLPCPPPGNLPNPGIKPTSLTSPALAGMFFTTRAHLGSPLLYPHPDEIMRNLDSQVIKVNARIKSIRSGTSYFLLKHKHHHFFLVILQEVEFKRNASEPGFTQWLCVTNKVIMGLNDSYFILLHAIYKFSMTISNIFQCLIYELMRFFSFSSFPLLLLLPSLSPFFLLLKPIWFPIVNSIWAKTAMKRKLCSDMNIFFLLLHSELFVLLAPSEYSWRDSVSVSIWSVTDCQTTVLFQGFGK